MGRHGNTPHNADQIANGTVSNTEFEYLDGVTSAIQTQIDGAGSIGSGEEYLPASSIQPRISNGCAPLASFESATSLTNIEYLAFDKDADEFAYLDARVPTGASGTFKITYYWTSNSTDTGDVEWTAQAQSLANDDAFTAAFGTAVAVEDSGLGAAKDLHVSALSGVITPSGSPAVGDYIQIQIFRDISADNFAADAWLVGVLVTWTAA